MGAENGRHIIFVHDRFVIDFHQEEA